MTERRIRHMPVHLGRRTGGHRQHRRRRAQPDPASSNRTAASWSSTSPAERRSAASVALAGHLSHDPCTRLPSLSPDLTRGRVADVPGTGQVVAALRARGLGALPSRTRSASPKSPAVRCATCWSTSGIVTEIELAEALAEAYGLKSVDIVGYPVDLAAAAQIPVALSRRHRVLGIAIDDEEIVVAIADPGDVLAIDDVRAATGLQVRPVVVARDELNKAIDRFQRSENDLDDVAASLGDDDMPTLDQRLDSVDEDAPIVRYANSLIEQAIDNRASDLHIEPTESRPAGALPHRRRAARDRHRAARPCSRR